MDSLYHIARILVILSIFHTSAFAQFSGGIHFNYTNPLEEYNDNLIKDPVGFTLSTYYTPTKAPMWQFGVEMGVAMYANDSYYTELDNGKQVEIDEEDCFLTYHVTAKRFLFKGNLFNPYGEIRAGGVSFFSTRFAAQEKYEDDFEGNTTFHGTAFNLGLGGGININFIENMMFDLGAVYNKGTRTHYRSIEPGEGAQVMPLDFGRKESYVHSITFKLGILFGF